MPACTFQTPYPPNSDVLKGEIRVSVYEQGGTSPKTSIKATDDWYIDVEWKWEGSLLDFGLSGRFDVQVYLESIGAANEHTLPAKTVTFGPGDSDFSDRYNVAAGTLEVGPYKLVVTATQYNPLGVPTGVIGVCEGPILTIYNA